MGKSESLLARLKSRAGDLQREVHALFLAYRDPRTPWIARVVALLVVGYAVSPIDLVPDFIPVLGYLDDLILVPAGVALALKLIPGQVMADARAKADRARQEGKMNGWVGVMMVVIIWLGALALVVLVGLRFYRGITGR